MGERGGKNTSERGKQFIFLVLSFHVQRCKIIVIYKLGYGDVKGPATTEFWNTIQLRNTSQKGHENDKQERETFLKLSNLSKRGH